MATNSSLSETEGDENKPIPIGTVVTWAKMIGYTQTKSRYDQNCGGCKHFIRRESEGMRLPLGGCSLHNFIIHTTPNNVCEMIEYE